MDTNAFWFGHCEGLRGEFARQLAESDPRSAKWAKRCGRLEADLAHVQRGAIRAGETIAELRARVAELEAEADVSPCDDCRGDCDERDCEEVL